MGAPAELLVAGAGPVGLAAALGAAREGMRVRVLDPRDPRDGIDKACGEGLMPSAVAALAALGVHPPGRPFAGIAYLDARDRRRAQARFADAAGLGVRRTTLSRALHEAALDAGVEVTRAALAELAQDDDGVHVRDRAGRSWHGEWLIAADGLHSRVRTLLEPDPAPAARRRARAHPGVLGRTPPTRHGLRRHYRIAPWSDLVEVRWAAHAEAYVTPVADDLVGVAVLCGGGRSFDAWLADFPALATRLAAGRAAGPVRGCGPLRQRCAHRVHGRVLLAGDAAGYVDALTGEGLAVGLRSAEAAVDCIVGGRPETYEEHWTAITRRPRILTEALLRGTRPRWVRGLIVPAASGVPPLFRAAVRALA